MSVIVTLFGKELTKLDGTAKGGIVIAVRDEVGIPVKLIGIGEQIDDLRDFNASDFVEALFAHGVDWVLAAGYSEKGLA